MYLPLPVPGSIYGLILMLLGLCTHIIPLEKVYAPGRFLVDIMPVMFIPAAVALMDSWHSLRAVFFPIAVITVLSTFLVMAVSGLVTQALMRKNGTGEDEK